MREVYYIPCGGGILHIKQHPMFTGFADDGKPLFKEGTRVVTRMRELQQPEMSWKDVLLFVWPDGKTYGPEALS